MIYIACAIAAYLVAMLAVASFSVAAGLVLLTIGMVFGGAFAASLAG